MIVVVFMIVAFLDLVTFIFSVNKMWKNFLIMTDDVQLKMMGQVEAKQFKNYKNICVRAYNLKVRK